MNSHTSPCDHMTLFVPKSSPEQTRVLRRMTGRLTVRRLVNINPGRPKNSSTATPRKPQHHRLRSPRSESKSFFFLNRVHGIKRASQEEGDGGGVAAITRRAQEVVAAQSAEPEEVEPPSPAELEKVPPPHPRRCRPPPR
jgi:hypothetical protein